MDQIIGNVVENAEVKTSKNEKKFIAFRVAVNKKRFKSGTRERETITKFYNCYYWLSTGIAEYLTTGVKVSLGGEKEASAWIDKQGQAKVNYLFYADEIELLSYGKAGKERQTSGQKEPAQQVAEPAADDLPF